MDDSQSSFLERTLSLHPADLQAALPPADPRDGLGTSLMSAALVRAAFIQPTLLPMIYDELGAVIGVLPRRPGAERFPDPGARDFPATHFWISFWNLVSSARQAMPEHEALWQASCALQTLLAPDSEAGMALTQVGGAVRTLEDPPALPDVPREDGALARALAQRLGRDGDPHDAGFIAVLGTIRAYDDTAAFSRLLMELAAGWIAGRRAAA